jgi:hypothetical protein
MSAKKAFKKACVKAQKTVAWGVFATVAVASSAIGVGVTTGNLLHKEPSAAQPAATVTVPADMRDLKAYTTAIVAQRDMIRKLETPVQAQLGPDLADGGAVEKAIEKSMEQEVARKQAVEKSKLLLSWNINQFENYVMTAAPYSEQQIARYVDAVQEKEKIYRGFDEISDSIRYRDECQAKGEADIGKCASHRSSGNRGGAFVFGLLATIGTAGLTGTLFGAAGNRTRRWDEELEKEGPGYTDADKIREADMPPAPEITAPPPPKTTPKRERFDL